MEIKVPVNEERISYPTDQLIIYLCFLATISESDGSLPDETLSQVFSPNFISSIFPATNSEPDSSLVSDERLSNFCPSIQAIFPATSTQTNSPANTKIIQYNQPKDIESCFPPMCDSNNTNSEPDSSPVSYERLSNFCPSIQAIFPATSTQTNSPANTEIIQYDHPIDIESCFPPRCDSDSFVSYDINNTIKRYLRSFSISWYFPSCKSNGSEDASYPNGNEWSDSSSVAMPGEEEICMTITKKTHFSHQEHELVLKSYQRPYTCDGCKELGFGPRYRCELCDFDLHKECTFTSPTTSHEFFKESTFKFFDQPTRKCTKGKENCNKCKLSYCDACGKTINGFVYHCEEKDRNLHPCCRNFKHKISLDDVEFRLCVKVSQKCGWCKKRKLPNSMRDIPRWSYVSKCKQYHFHVYCIMEMVLENWKKWPKDNNCFALESLELPLANSSKKGGQGRKYLRMGKIFLITIGAVLY